MAVSYVPVIEAEVLAGVGETEVRRIRTRVHDGQWHGHQAPPQQAALLVQGGELTHHHGLHRLREVAHRSVDFTRDLPFQFIPAVLEPYLHLRFGELQRAGETGALGAAQVALHVERRLQLEDLSLGKNGARFLFRDHFTLLRGTVRFKNLRGRGGGAAVVATTVPALEARLRRPTVNVNGRVAGPVILLGKVCNKQQMPQHPLRLCHPPARIIGDALR